MQLPIKSRIIILITLAVSTMISCSKGKSNEFIDNEYMIQVPGSELYLRVRGNPKNPIILNLHGGPGGYSGIDIKLMGPYLEDDFLVAYLDQRGCGKSLAFNDTSMLTVDQYIQDLNIVIDSLRIGFEKNKVNLLGTSWGGMYGFLYILSFPEKVNAYACISGKANSHYQNNALIDFELCKAKQLLKEASQEVRQKKLEYIIERLEKIKNSNFTRFHEDVNWMKHEVPGILGFNAYFADTAKIISTEDVLRDTSLMLLMNYSKEEFLEAGEKAEIVNRAFRNNQEYNTLNIQPLLHRIKVPTAVIQGEKDYVVGTGHAELIYEALTGLPKNLRELHIIPDVAHSPAIESPEELSGILLSFLKRFNS